MDIGKSFTYLFEDEDWVAKFLIGGVVNLIPIANLAATGYQVQMIRNVAGREQRPLPQWKDFGDYFVGGLLVAVATLIYAIPIFLLVAFVAILSALASASAGGSSGNVLAAILAVAAVAVGGLAVVYGLMFSLWLPAATTRYALAEDLGAFFRFDEIWHLIVRNPGDYVVALVVAWLAGLIAALVGGFLLFIGMAFTGFWAMLVFAHLFGQVARGSEETALAG